MIQNKRPTKRGISKNYFHWEPSVDRKIYDQRDIVLLLHENKNLEKYGLSYNDINTKILIYEDRVIGWFLEIANTLKQNNEAGFVILQTAISYLEGNQQYREGKPSFRKSETFFKEALKRIFPEIYKIPSIDLLLHDFYTEVRCGLFHDGMTRKSVTINTEFTSALSIQDNTIEINPHMFLDKIIDDFNEYIAKLKDPSNSTLRTNFEKMWVG